MKRPKKRPSLKQTKLPNTSQLISQQQNSTETTTTTTTMSCDQQSEDDLSSKTAIKVELEATTSDQSSTTTLNTSPKKSAGPGQDVKRITFDESCKKESFDDVNPNYPQISVRPPTPLRGDAIKPNVTSTALTASLLSAKMLPEIRRHSSHATSLTVREFEQKDRRHSGFNPNLLSLDPEHIKFMNNSPAASRRISCGSLFKVRGNIEKNFRLEMYVR